MAHFARLDENDIVTEVIVVHNNELLDENGQESEQKGIEFLIDWSGGWTRWKQTSYNGAFRKRYAGLGYRYDEQFDAFIPPKPYSKWVFNEETLAWDPPIPCPVNGKIYIWNDDLGQWVELNPVII